MFAARFHNVDVFLLKVKDYDVCVSGKIHVHKLYNMSFVETKANNLG